MEVKDAKDQGEEVSCCVLKPRRSLSVVGSSRRLFGFEKMQCRVFDSRSGCEIMGLVF